MACDRPGKHAIQIGQHLADVTVHSRSQKTALYAVGLTEIHKPIMLGTPKSIGIGSVGNEVKSQAGSRFVIVVRRVCSLTTDGCYGDETSC